MIILHLFVLVILCIATVESILWAFTIYNHCRWAKKNGIIDRRNISYKSLSIFSILAGIFSFGVWLFFVYFISLSAIYVIELIILFGMFTFFQVICCHSWHLISTYICIPLEFTPFMSKWLILISNKILKSNHRINSITLDKWEDMFERSVNYRTLALNFVDLIPRMIWTKDIDNKYTFVNTSLCKNLLLMSEFEVLNKTNIEIAEELSKRGISYSFGEICFDTDEITKERNTPTIFRQYGIVNDKQYVFNILKSPIYNKDKMIGTIGIAKDITYYINVYNNIERLFKEKKYEEAEKAFTIFKNRFDSLIEF